MRGTDRRLLIGTLTAVLVVAACSSGESTTSTTTTTTVATTAPATSQATTTSTSPPEPTCSAESLDPVTEPRTNITEEAETTRMALIEAALVCDYKSLAELAAAGSVPFESDGGSDLPAAWEAGEDAGEEPMRVLVILLRGTMGTVALEAIEYRFPSAAGFAEWADVPEDLRQRLKPLYTEADWPRFEAAGVYDGVRTSIADSGEWLSFFAAR
jgi:hypothetical protein